MKLLSLLESALNRYLNLDPESKTRLDKLDNKIVLIQLSGLNIDFILMFSAGKIRLKTYDLTVDSDIMPHVSIKGTPLSLLHVALTKHNRHQFFSDDVVIEGDAELAQQVMHLFDHLEIDWEEYLSRAIGDAPAHQTGKIIQTIKKFKKRARSVLTQNLNEYLHEEKEFFPTAEALQDFFQEIDALRMDTDRLEAKVLHLQNKMKET